MCFGCNPALVIVHMHIYFVTCGTLKIGTNQSTNQSTIIAINDKDMQKKLNILQEGNYKKYTDKDIQKTSRKITKQKIK